MSGRAEFRALYNHLTNTEYVERLFATTGVTPTLEERGTLITNLENGTENRVSVLRKVVDGTRSEQHGDAINQVFTSRYVQAFYEQQFNRAFVLMQYFGYLRRDPDEAGYAFWLDKLYRFGNFTDAEMVRAFIVAPEYRSRFGQP